MKNNNNLVEKQINRMHYEDYIYKLLIKMDGDTTQVFNNEIRTYDLGLATLAIVNKYEIEESPSEKGLWIIKINKAMEDFYGKYKKKESLVEPVVYSKTILNLISQK